MLFLTVSNRHFVGEVWIRLHRHSLQQPACSSAGCWSWDYSRQWGTWQNGDQWGELNLYSWVSWICSHTDSWLFIVNTKICGGTVGGDTLARSLSREKAMQTLCSMIKLWEVSWSRWWSHSQVGSLGAAHHRSVKHYIVPWPTPATATGWVAHGRCPAHRLRLPSAIGSKLPCRTCQQWPTLLWIIACRICCHPKIQIHQLMSNTSSTSSCHVALCCLWLKNLQSLPSWHRPNACATDRPLRLSSLDLSPTSLRISQ